MTDKHTKVAEIAALLKNAPAALHSGAPDCLSIDNDGDTGAFEDGTYVRWLTDGDAPLVVAVISPIGSRDQANQLADLIAALPDIATLLREHFPEPALTAVACPWCNGTGHETPCSRCDGTGRITGGKA